MTTTEHKDESRTESVLSFADWGETTAPRLIRRYSDLFGEYGYVRGIDVPDSLDHFALFARFGSPVPGPSGQLVEEVTPAPGMDDVYYGGNRKELFPHTEGYEMRQNPPAQLALWCVEPVHGPGGETLLWDTSEAIAEAQPDLLKMLTDLEFEFHSSEGLQRLRQGDTARRPILTRRGYGEDILRFSLNNMRDSDAPPEVLSFRENCWQRFDRECVRVTYRRNDFLHWNNWRLLHARTAFSGRRLLRRMQLDPRA